MVATQKRATSSAFTQRGRKGSLEIKSQERVRSWCARIQHRQSGQAFNDSWQAGRGKTKEQPRQCPCTHRRQSVRRPQ